MACRSEQIRALTAVNTADVVSALGWQDAPAPLQAAVGWAFRRPALRLAHQLADFDDAVTRDGLATASAELLTRFGPACRTTGTVPAEGPVLVVSNHPGLFDALALFASLPRPDVTVVALQRPVLRALPGLGARMIGVPESGGRTAALRAAASRLRAGEVVVTFPGGTIEPDPGVRPWAADAVGAWSASTRLLTRLVPGLQVVPTAIAGSHTARALNHPVTRLRRNADDRDWLGAVLQVLVPALRTREVRVSFGEPTPDADEAYARVRALLATTPEPC